MIDQVRTYIERKSTILFILAVSFVAYQFQYHKTTFLRPQSIHAWRQSDGASFALNYYQHGMNFFKPELHNLKADENTSGYEVSEAPIICYLVACAYCVLGYHEFLFRLINGALFLLGMYYLFRTMKLWSGNSTLSILSSLLLFCSPVLAYYANSFMPNTSSLAFVFIAWYHFTAFYKNEKERHFYFSLFFFLLAAWLKIISLISLNALFLAFLLETTSFFKFDKKIFPSRSTTIWAFVLTYLLVALWYIYVFYYNHIHKSIYFNNKTMPFWQLNCHEILENLRDIKELWFNEYFNRSLYLIFFVVLIVNIGLRKRLNSFLIFTLTGLAIQVVVFVMLWFRQFHDHDYYFLDLYILFIFLVMPLIEFSSYLKNRVYTMALVVVLTFALLFYNLGYVNNHISYRYDENGWMNKEYKYYKVFGEIKPYLRSLGIHESDKVLCIGDPTNCYSLYLMNQFGWTQYGRTNSDSVGISHTIDKGATYMILFRDGDTKLDFIQSYTHKHLGTYKSVDIYDLRKE